MQVKPIKLTGAAAQPPPLAVRPPVQPTYTPGYIPTPYTAYDGFSQVFQQPGWVQSAPGASFTFVPTPTSTPNPGPDQGSMPFSYPRRPVLPAYCSAWQIPTQIHLPQVGDRAQELGPRCRSAPNQPQPVEEMKPLQTHRSADAAFDLDSVLDSEPLYLGEDSDLFDSEFGDIFGTAETQQHDVRETAVKLEALVCPGKASEALPFGLRLKKSESFVNLINKQLAEARSLSAIGFGSQ